MFTLKLYRRRNGQLVTKVLAVHHVTTMEIGTKKKTLEIWAHRSTLGSDYEAYYVGEREDDMTALTDENHFGWGLLENWEGNTTEHYRPSSYG
jgi:hypothetical protein